MGKALNIPDFLGKAGVLEITCPTFGGLTKYLYLAPRKHGDLTVLTGDTWV
jgi:hypothetical protein